MAGLWLWSTIKQTPISRRAGIGLAVLFLCLAVFNAWREEYHRRKGLEAMSLVGQFAGLAVAPAEAEQQSSLVTVMGVISNPTGPSTIVTSFALTAILANGQSLEAIPVALSPGDTVLGFDQNKSGMVLKQSDYWPDSGIATPIPTGGARKGWITGVIRNVSKQKLIEDKAKLIVSFQDVKGNKYSLEGKVTGIPSELMDQNTVQPRHPKR